MKVAPLTALVAVLASLTAAERPLRAPPAPPAPPAHPSCDLRRDARWGDGACATGGADSGAGFETRETDEDNVREAGEEEEPGKREGGEGKEELGKGEEGEEEVERAKEREGARSLTEEGDFEKFINEGHVHIVYFYAKS